MSDDEDYYDEFDEIFWIEEPDPEIAVCFILLFSIPHFQQAVKVPIGPPRRKLTKYCMQDDLAATATYDAVFFEDPSFEVEEFFSDWDEISDDYYDEDPTAARIQRVMAKWPNRDLNVNYAAESLPQKKRKRHPDAKPKLFAPETDVASFRGTVWRTSTDENNRSKLYEPGDGEKVALLKNWREVFRTSHPATDRTRIRKPAVAGSAPAKGRAQVVNGAGKRVYDNEEDRMVEEWDADGEAEDANAPVKAFSPPPVHMSRVIESAADMPVNSKMIEHEYPIEAHEDYEETLELEAREPKEADRTRTQKTQVNGVSSGKSNQTTRGRKRKASVSHDESQATTNKNGSNEPWGPRSKRIATKKVGEAIERQEESTGPVRRSARNREKN